MAGTLFGLGLSQQHDINGSPMPGCLLYVYQAATTTPVTTYRDNGLSLVQPWPLVSDAAGRLPQFWVPDGTYRARLTNSVGAVQFDEDNVLAIGPSTGAGGGGPAINPDSILSTGDVKWKPGAEILTGWVRANGKTIGDASSGATEMHDASCLNLFEWIWNNIPDSICPVTPSRGSSAASDWAAHRQIALLDMRGKTASGLDDMGNSSASRFNGVPNVDGNAITPGSTLGENQHTLAGSEFPVHNHGTSETAHHHSFDFQQVQVGGGAGPFVSNLLATGNTKTTTDQSTGLTINNAGSGGAHNNAGLQIVGTWYMRL